MKIKNIVTGLLVAFILVSCVPATELVVTKVVPKKTAIPLTPTVPPVETLVPTVDTNAPEKWQGEKDIQGNYIIREQSTDGEIIKTWVEYKSPSGETLWNGWTVNKTEGKGIPIWDIGLPNHPYNRIGNIMLLCSDTVPECYSIPRFIHIDKTPEMGNDSDLTSTSFVKLFQRTHEGKDPSGADAMEINGDFHLEFFLDTPENTLAWNLSPSNGAIEILSSWLSLDGADEFYFGNLHIRMRIAGVDTNGELIVLLASEKPVNSLTDFEFSGLIFLAPSLIIQQEDLSNTTSLEVLMSFVNAADNPSSKGNLWIESISK